MNEEHKTAEQPEKKEAVRELVTVLRTVGDDTYDRLVKLGVSPEDANACRIDFGIYAKKIPSPLVKKDTPPSAEKKAAPSDQNKPERPELSVILDERLWVQRPICPYCGSDDAGSIAPGYGCVGAFSSFWGFVFIPVILVFVVLIGAGIEILLAVITAVVRAKNKNMMKCRKCGKVFKYDRGKK